MLEDALVARDHEGLELLFEGGALLVDEGAGREARGGEEIARFAAAMGRRQPAYLADPRRVLQARDTALVVVRGGANVVRRGSDGAWRYVISLLEFDPAKERTSA